MRNADLVGSNGGMASWLSQRNLGMIAIGLLILYAMERFVKACHHEVFLPVFHTTVQVAERTHETLAQHIKKKHISPPIVLTIPRSSIVSKPQPAQDHMKRFLLAVVELTAALCVVYVVFRIATRPSRHKSAPTKSTGLKEGPAAGNKVQ